MTIHQQRVASSLIFDAHTHASRVKRRISIPAAIRHIARRRSYSETTTNLALFLHKLELTKRT